MDKRKLLHYLNCGYNVLFEGLQGTGKTTVVLEVFKEAGLKYKYFSSPTMDPWVDFVGIPKEVNGHIELIKPKEFADDEIEAIFLDEYNRAKPKTMSAVMELIQFKSINGRKFNNLKVVWAAINPANDEFTVEKLDPAQEDRFQIKIRVPYEPNKEYFINKYGDNGKAAREWWMALPEDIRRKTSPRRLDYALDVLKNNGDVRDVFDQSVNVSQFLSIIKIGSISEKMEELFGKNDEEITQWINVENNYAASIYEILKSKKYKERFIPLLNEERLASLIVDRYDVLKFVCSNYFYDDRLNKTLDNITRKCDTAIRIKISKEIDTAIPKFSKIKDTLNIGTEPITNNFYGSPFDKTTLANIQNVNLEAPAARLNFISKLYTDLPSILQGEDIDCILEKIEYIMMRSHFNTINKYKNKIIAILNHCFLYSNSKKYDELFDVRYYKTHQKLYGSKLYSHLIPENMIGSKNNQSTNTTPIWDF